MKEAVIPKTLKEILEEIHKNSLSETNIHIRMFPLNKEVSVHFSYGDISYITYITYDVDPRRAVSDLMEKLGSINGYEFDPRNLFFEWKGFETKYINRARVTMDKIYRERAGLK